MRSRSTAFHCTRGLSGRTVCPLNDLTEILSYDHQPA